MKKIILTLLAFFSMGMSHQVTYTFDDVYWSVLHVAGLHFQVDNPENQTRKVRITYQFFGLEDMNYYIANGCLAAPYVEEGEMKWKDYDGIEDAQINLIDKNGRGYYVVDVMFDMPKGKKEFCISLRENKFRDFKVEGHDEVLGYMHRYDMSVDGESNRYIDTEGPLKNKITYNYVSKQRSVDHQLKKGETFDAMTLYDAKTPGLTDEERFFNYGSGSFKNVPAKSLVDLNVESYGVIKDTRMLMAASGLFVDEHRWNESTFDAHYLLDPPADERLNKRDFGRCWAIAVFNLYSYFYGNRNTKADALTQDEIVFMGKVTVGGGNPAIGVFRQDASEGFSDVASARLINKVMFGAEAASHVNSKEPLNGDKIYNLIKGDEAQTGKPLFISIHQKGEVSGHVMLIDGLAVTNDEKKDTLVHLINLDNYGRESYVYLKALQKVLTGYITYNMPLGFAKTDVLHPVDVDSDDDGVVDFDEFYRFKTEENKYSSKDDGRSDYERLHLEYMAKFLDFDAPGEISFNLAEIEDAVDIPDRTALYALNSLILEDNVSCRDNFLTETQGCKIVSEGIGGKGTAVDEGCRSLVNVIYSKGDVAVCAGAEVGNIAIYAENESEHHVSCRDVDGECPQNIYYPNIAGWPFNVKKKVGDVSEIIGKEEKVVKSGESFTISGENGHNNFASLKVEKGGKLIIGTGKIYVGNIQLEWGSSFMFEHPSYMTVLHLNGSVAWHGEYERNPDIKIERQSPSVATAKGFKLIQHSAEGLDISSIWHGSIIAPYSTVIMGSTSESRAIYGQILANDITIRQNSDVFNVNYAPNDPAMLAKDEKSEDATNVKSVRTNAKIMNVSRDEIDFMVTNPGLYKICVMKLDGSVVSSFVVNQLAVGMATVKWNGANFPKGAYILSIKSNGKRFSKMISLM